MDKSRLIVLELIKRERGAFKRMRRRFSKMDTAGAPPEDYLSASAEWAEARSARMAAQKILRSVAA